MLFLHYIKILHDADKFIIAFLLKLSPDTPYKTKLLLRSIIFIYQILALNMFS